MKPQFKLPFKLPFNINFKIIGNILDILYIITSVLFLTLDTVPGIVLLSVTFAFQILALILDPERRKKILSQITEKGDITVKALGFTVIWTLLSAIWSRGPLDSLGIGMMEIMMYLMFLKIRVSDSRYRKYLFNAYILGILIPAAYLIYQNVTHFLREGKFVRGEYVSTLENANSLGVVLMIAFFTSLFALMSSKDLRFRALYLTLMMVSFGGIFLAQSRAVLGLMLLGILYIAVKLNKKLIWVFLAFVIIISTVPQIQQRFLDIFSYEQNVQRIKIWKTAWALFKENPITGIGASAFRFEYNEYFNKHPELFNEWDIQGIWHAHNMILRFLAELGIPGFAGMAMTGFGLYSSSKGKAITEKAGKSLFTIKKGLIIALIAFAAASMVDSYFMEPKVMMVLFFTMGLLENENRSDNA